MYFSFGDKMPKNPARQVKQANVLNKGYTSFDKAFNAAKAMKKEHKGREYSATLGTNGSYRVISTKNHKIPAFNS